jgi:Domain of unknown function (DUF5666)
MDSTTEPDPTEPDPSEPAPDELDSTGIPADPKPPRNGVSRTVLILSVLAGMAVAGVAGVIIGWKVEQERVKDDIGNIRPVGQVSAVEGDEVTVDLLTSSGSRTYVLTDDTVIHEAASADASAVAEGSTVLVKSRRDDDGSLRAVEVIVLPEETTFGSGRDD